MSKGTYILFLIISILFAIALTPIGDMTFPEIFKSIGGFLHEITHF